MLDTMRRSSNRSHLVISDPPSLIERIHHAGAGGRTPPAPALSLFDTHASSRHPLIKVTCGRCGTGRRFGARRARLVSNMKLFSGGNTFGGGIGYVGYNVKSPGNA